MFFLKFKAQIDFNREHNSIFLGHLIIAYSAAAADLD